MSDLNGFVNIALIIWLIVGMYNPKKGIFWEAKEKSRGRFLVYFISVAVVVTIIQIATKPQSSEEHTTNDYSETQRTLALERNAKIDSSKVRSITKLISNFSELTDLQQKEWNSNHEWEYTVEGTGQVTEVGETNFLSEEDSLPYEVTVELSNGERAVVYYPKNKRSYVLSLDKGSTVGFMGKLKNIKDYGFWKTAYVKYIPSRSESSKSFSEKDAQLILERLKKHLGATEFITSKEIRYNDGDSGFFFLYNRRNGKLGAAAFNITENINSGSSPSGVVSLTLENVRSVPLSFDNVNGISNVSSDSTRKGNTLIYFDYLPKKSNFKVRYFWNIGEGEIYYKKVFINSGEVEYSEGATDDKSFARMANIPLYLVE